jgi:hypothetical protein
VVWLGPVLGVVGQRELVPHAGGAGTGRGTRTPTGFRPTDFESVASSISPSRRVVIVGRGGNRRLVVMKRRERKLFEIGDALEALEEAERLAIEELGYHQHLNDDAQRDAAVSGSPIDRADARETAADVARFERHLESLRSQRRKLEAKRTRLLEKLRD